MVALKSSTPTLTNTSAGCSRCRARERVGVKRRHGRAASLLQPRSPRRRHAAQPWQLPRPHLLFLNVHPQEKDLGIKAQVFRPLRTEVQQIDGRLEKLGAEKAELEAALVAGSVPGDEMADTSRRLNHIAAETAMLEERWLMLHSEIESIISTGD